MLRQELEAAVMRASREWEVLQRGSRELKTLSLTLHCRP